MFADVSTSAAQSGGRQAAVQRLLIFHADLPRACTGRDLQLDESASDEEAAECVLYYRTARSLERDAEADEAGTANPREVRECVQFLGICQALYRLPASLKGGGSTDDSLSVESNATKEVLLGGSLLVFEVLEAPHVIAVAQVSRRSSATPRAVRAALRRSHQMFRLFRGGGILHRMGDCDRMRQLYELHRQRRRFPLKPESDGPGEEHGRRLSRDLIDLRRSLPITSVREELRIHYDTLLEDLSLAAAEGTGSGRGIVECVPTPVRLPTGRFSSEVVSSPIWSMLAHSINAAVKEYLIQQSREAGPASRAVAVSMFEHASLAGTLVSDDTSISDEVACLLFTHMSMLRSKMNPALDRGESAMPKANRGYTPLSVTFGKDMVEDATTNASNVPCRFMAPPPLALLSASDDDAQDFQGPVEGTRVWAPRVSLPQGAGTVADVRVTLYEANRYGFLIYFKCPPGEEEEGNDAMLSETLRTFDEMVSRTLSTQMLSELPVLDIDSSNLVGQDVILIHRSNLSLTLLRDPNHEKQDNSLHPSMPHKGRLRFFKSKFYADRTTHQSHQSPSRDRMLDPRYQLASTLSSESLAAFDDVMLDLQKASRLGVEEQSVEVCTLLPTRWMYAYSDGAHELYVFFDPAIYVTVNDVQHAADRIRSDLIETRRAESL